MFSALSPDATEKRLFRPVRQCLAIVLLTCLAVGAAATEPDAIDATSWRNQQLDQIAEKIDQAKSDEERLELAARQAWLQRWQPGQMPSAPEGAPMTSKLTDEPLLEDVQRPATIDKETWQQMVALQQRLIALDTLDQRKEKLRDIITLAKEVDQTLSDNLPAAPQRLETAAAWALAFARYRLGRALAYRELPVVRERWPISDPDQYQARLATAYRRLIDHSGPGRPEFILLEDRMLRRAGQRGQALELLETNRKWIRPKWYLKKRRDLLKELGWNPPYQEAAQRYHEAGYRDEP